MQVDVFARRRRDRLLFAGAVTAAAVGSAFATKFDPVVAATSVVQAAGWIVEYFYPDAHAIEKLPDILGKLWDTVLMAVAASTAGAVVASALAIAGARTTGPNLYVGLAVRAVASFCRNSPLVGWAMILLLAFSQSKMTGFLALSCGSVGFLTRAFVETFDEVGASPIEALRAAGAHPLHVISQAILPASLPLMMSWVLYTIDTNIRDAVLVGLVTGTGIGFSFDFYYKSFDFHAASLVTLVSAAAVIAVEYVSSRIRRILL
jgi:phosphonate transport system permease protein